MLDYTPEMLEYTPEDTEYATPEDYGYVHESNIPNTVELKGFVEEIMKAVYLTGDIALIESSLEGLCHELDINMTESEPILEKKGHQALMLLHLKSQSSMLNSWNKPNMNDKDKENV